MLDTADDLLIGHLLAGRSIGTAAELAGLSRKTADRRLADPAFREKLEEARAALRGRVLDRLAEELTAP
jgi:hypothetical protein